MNLKIVLASGAVHLKESFEKMGYKTYTSELNYDSKRIFPNTDIYSRISDIEELQDENVLLIQNGTCSSEAEKEFFTTSDRLIETLQIADLMRNPVTVEEIGHKKYKATPLKPAKRINTLYTFFPYAIQDKAFKTGEVISGRLALELTLMKSDKVYAIDPHYPLDIDWVSEAIKKDKLSVISLSKPLIQFAAKVFDFDEYMVVGPDEGAQARFGVKSFSKSRTDSFTVEVTGDFDVKGKNIIVIDDFTKSGSTLIKAKRRLLEKGAKKVGLAVTHVLPLKDKKEELLEKLIEKAEQMIVTTNTIYTKAFAVKHPELVMDIAKIIVKSI